jgi:uncharacterized protein
VPVHRPVRSAPSPSATLFEHLGAGASHARPRLHQMVGDAVETTGPRRTGTARLPTVGQSQRLAVSFPADDGERVGYLYLPAPNQNCRQRAGVVLCGGFGSTMERLYPHAAAFAAAGFTALVFDYRNFGHSEGHPRQLVDLSGQLSDIRAAITYLRCRGDVNPDHIVLWGNSLGGAHVISVAAEDPLIAAVIAQIPFNGFPRRVAGRSGWDTTRLLGAILWDQLRGVLRLPPYYIPLVGEPGRVAVTNATEANELVATLPDGNTLWQNRTAPRALLRMMRYHPSKAASRLSMPLLVCLAVDDQATPEPLARQLADQAPHGQLKRYPGTHFTFYHDEQTRRSVLADQIGFCRAELTG